MDTKITIKGLSEALAGMLFGMLVVGSLMWISYSLFGVKHVYIEAGIVEKMEAQKRTIEGHDLFEIR